MGSWNHLGRTGNMIIEDFMRQICVPLENSAYFGNGDGFDSNPDMYRDTKLMIRYILQDRNSGIGVESMTAKYAEIVIRSIAPSMWTKSFRGICRRYRRVSFQHSESKHSLKLCRIVYPSNTEMTYSYKACSRNKFGRTSIMAQDITGTGPTVSR